MKRRILVIAPHADDEILGCGGFLLHERDKGSEIHIVIGTIGGVDRRQNTESRIDEFNSVLKVLDARGNCLFFNKDAILDTVPSREITSKLDEIIDSIKPEMILVNYSSHHQDHKKLYDCAMASLRLREGYTPELVCLYEYPFIGGNSDYINGGRMYHDISDVIDDKIKLFELYKSQIREKPSPLNSNGVKSLAQIRGLEFGVDHAEMFYVIKAKI